MEFALGILAALIGASGAFTGAWLSGRHERQLEQERWLRAQADEAEDARAAAVTELTKHLASASQTITWFTTGAEMRRQLFTEQTIIDYDTDMRAHLSAAIQSLVAVAHRDEAAFRALEEITKELWALDWRLAAAAAGYWSDPEAARTEISQGSGSAIALEQSLPHRIVGVLQRDSRSAPS
jgi:hypothetical protein